MRRGAACADKANSGVMNLPCIKVAKYCTDKNFAAKLAVNCAKTCGKCGAWQLRACSVCRMNMPQAAAVSISSLAGGGAVT